MKKIYKLMILVVLMATMGTGVYAQYCNDFGATTSDNTRGWASTDFTVLGTTATVDCAVDGSGVITAGDLYRGVINAGSPVTVNQGVDVEVVLRQGPSFNWIHFVAYADWNQDGSFDATKEEIFYDGTNAGGNVDRTHTITVPADAKLGATKIRIIMGWFEQNTDPTADKYYSPCVITKDGANVKNARAFDFEVTVAEKPANPNVPTFSTQVGCVVVKDDVVTVTGEAGTTLKYTTDGTDAATSTTAMSSTTNTADVTVSADVTVKAVAVKDGLASTVATADYEALDVTLGSTYYVVFQRYNGDLAMQDMGDAAKLQTQTYTLGAVAQEWKIQKGTVNGLYTLTSGNGNSVAFDGSRYTASSTEKVNLRIVKSGNADYFAYGLQREDKTDMGMNPFGGSAVGKEIGEYYTSDGGNALKFVTPKDGLFDKIAEATALKNKAKLNTEFGGHKEVDVNALKTAIDNAQGVYDNAAATNTDYSTAISDLDAAMTVFKGTTRNTDFNLLLSATPTTKYRWFTIRSAAYNKSYIYNKVISSEGRSVDEKYTFVDKADPVTDAQLFRFETDGTNITNIINKVGDTYFAQDGAIKADASGNTGTFSVALLDDGISYNINPSTGPKSIHGQASGSHVVNWDGAEGTASAWVFDYVKDEDIPTAPFTVTVASADAAMGTAVVTGTTNTTTTTTSSVSVTAGPVPGHVFVKWTDGSADVSTDATYTYTGTTDVTFTAHFEKLGTGVVEAPTKDTYYYIQSASNGTVATLGYKGDFRNEVLISPTVENQKIMHDVKGSAGDNALWLVTEDASGELKLKNKGTEMFLDNRHSVATKTLDAATKVEFVNVAGDQYAIKQMAADGVTISHLLAWKNNKADAWSSSQGENGLTSWYFVKESIVMSGTENIAAEKYAITVANGIVSVAGVETFDVYTVSGQKVNANNRLQQGVYIVKVKDSIQKVFVK